MSFVAGYTYVAGRSVVLDFQSSIIRHQVTDDPMTEYSGSGDDAPTQFTTGRLCTISALIVLEGYSSLLYVTAVFYDNTHVQISATSSIGCVSRKRRSTQICEGLRSHIHICL